MKFTIIINFLLETNFLQETTVFIVSLQKNKQMK